MSLEYVLSATLNPMTFWDGIGNWDHEFYKKGRGDGILRVLMSLFVPVAHWTKTSRHVSWPMKSDVVFLVILWEIWRKILEGYRSWMLQWPRDLLANSCNVNRILALNAEGFFFRLTYSYVYSCKARTKHDNTKWLLFSGHELLKS